MTPTLRQSRIDLEAFKKKRHYLSDNKQSGLIPEPCSVDKPGMTSPVKSFWTRTLRRSKRRLKPGETSAAQRKSYWTTTLASIAGGVCSAGLLCLSAGKRYSFGSFSLSLGSSSLLCWARIGGSIFLLLLFSAIAAGGILCLSAHSEEVRRGQS